MFRKRFLNFCVHPVICYEFFNTLYSIVKPVSDFWNCAALRSMAAITEWNATGSWYRKKYVKHAAFRYWIRSGKYVLLHIHGVPLQNFCQNLLSALWNVILFKNAAFRCGHRNVLSDSWLSGKYFPLHNCGIPVCKYCAERRIFSKIGDQFYFRVQGVLKIKSKLQGDQKILTTVSGTWNQPFSTHPWP